MCVRMFIVVSDTQTKKQWETNAWGSERKLICVSVYECVHTGVTDSEIQNEAESEQRKTRMCWCVSSGKL